MSVEGTVYLLHFAAPVGHASHYIGWTSKDPAVRLNEHRGRRYGNPLVRKAHQLGEVTLARVWKGNRFLERKLKRRKNSAQLCPICQGDK